MATLSGARAMGRQDIGQLVVGAKADLVIRRDDLPEMIPGGDPEMHLALVLRTKGVETVLCNGETVVENGRLAKVDQDVLFAKARKTARSLAERADLPWAGGTADDKPAQRRSADLKDETK